MEVKIALSLLRGANFCEVEVVADVVLYAARRQNLVRRALGAPPRMRSSDDAS